MRCCNEAPVKVGLKDLRHCDLNVRVHLFFSFFSCYFLKLTAASVGCLARTAETLIFIFFGASPRSVGCPLERRWART